MTIPSACGSVVSDLSGRESSEVVLLFRARQRETSLTSAPNLLRWIDSSKRGRHEIFVTNSEDFESLTAEKRLIDNELDEKRQDKASHLAKCL